MKATHRFRAFVAAATLSVSSLVLVLPPVASAALPILSYLGSVTEIDLGGGTVTVTTEQCRWFFIDEGWFPCSYQLEAVAPNLDALYGLRVGDAVEASAFGTAGAIGDRWVTIARAGGPGSVRGPLMVDLYGDPHYRFSDFVADIAIEYESEPDCAQCGCLTCVAASSTVSLSQEPQGLFKTCSLLPGEACSWQASGHTVALTFHHGEAHGFTCIEDPCVGPQPESNFTIHIQPAVHTRWVEIVAHVEGTRGSRWRTDVIARNRATADASVELVLHTENGDHEISTVIPAASQGVFEDIVAIMDYEGKGCLEVRSNIPLHVLARIYNQTDQGSFGQAMPSYEGTDGLSAGATAWLYGLRQSEDAYRSNISATNTGSEVAELDITLFDTTGTELDTYTMQVAPGAVEQDLEPIKHRAGRPDLGWGFASVRVVAGAGILVSASVIDTGTNDPTTISMESDAPSGLGASGS